MNILQILPEMNVGGVERGTLDLARYLVAQGHCSIVVSNGGKLVEELEEGGSEHYVLPVHEKNLFTMCQCVKALERIIREKDVDIIHARSRVPAWIAYFASRKTNAEFMTTCHGYYSENIFGHVMGWGKRVIVISEIIGRHMLEDFRVRPENMRLIHRSVDLEKFPFRPRRKGGAILTVSIVGRITPLKGHEYFLKAMAGVMRQMPYVRAKVIGDAPASKMDYKNSLVHLAKRLGIEDKVDFMGARRDIPELLKNTDVLVLSTVTQEAFGRVLIEAQAVGVPVVATKVGGVVDVVKHEKTGLCVPPRDADAIAAAVVRLFQYPGLVDSLTVEARKNVEEKYALEQMCSRTIEVYEEVKNSMNILVIKLSAVGDVILAVPALRALREKYPHARISCLVGRDGSSILAGCPYVDDVIIYDHKNKDAGVKCFWSMLLRLRKYRFDKVIDFQNNARSHLLAFGCSPRASYGYRNSKLGFLLTDGIKDTVTNIPPVRHQFRVLERLGIRYHDRVRLELWPRPDDRAYAEELLRSEWIDDKNHRIVGINISASERWPTKNLPMKTLAELCDFLAADNVRVIVTGMDKDRALSRELQGYLRSKPAIFLGKTNLIQLAALISRCEVYVSSDSAPLHVAAAMNVPVVAIFGPTSPERHVPPAEKIVVMKKNQDCEPCYKAQCRKGGHLCMNGFAAREIRTEIRKFLTKGRG